MCEQQCQERSHSRRGQARENRNRMNVAFIENAKDNIDYDNRRQDQEWFALERRSKLGSATGKSRSHCFRKTDLFFGGLDRFYGFAKRSTRMKIERKRHRRE